MRRFALPAVLIGLMLAGAVIAASDWRALLATLRGAGWAILMPVLLHLPQLVFSAFGWRVLIDRAPVPGIGAAIALRWVKEGVNALLPLAQVGGDLVRGRLFVRRGGTATQAAGTGLVDIAIELAAQLAFTLGALALLMGGPHPPGAGRVAIVIGATGLLIAAAVVTGVRLGLIEAIERVAAAGPWRRLGDLTGLDAAVSRIARARRRLWLSGGHHLVSWVAGGLEAYAALSVLGLAPTARDALAIEALGQALRGAAIVVPGALGVQEGGYVLLGALFGIPPHDALALSVIRRLRDLAFGMSGLAIWRWAERRCA